MSANFLIKILDHLLLPIKTVFFEDEMPSEFCRKIQITTDIFRSIIKVAAFAYSDNNYIWYCIVWTQILLKSHQDFHSSMYQYSIVYKPAHIQLLEFRKANEKIQQLALLMIWIVFLCLIHFKGFQTFCSTWNSWIGGFVLLI